MNVLRVGLVPLALAAFLALAGPAAAAPDRLSIGSLTLEVGEEGTLELRATEIEEPGIGAWQIDINFDPTIAEVMECIPLENSLCNTHFTAQTIRLTGASAAGLPTEATLAAIAFRCLQEGASALSIVVDVWGPAVGPPEPLPLTKSDIQDGAITCVSPATDTPTALPTSTPLPALPTSGAGRPGDGPVWFVGALVATAAAGAILFGFGLRRRRR